MYGVMHVILKGRHNANKNYYEAVLDSAMSCNIEQIETGLWDSKPKLLQVWANVI